MNRLGGMTHVTSAEGEPVIRAVAGAPAPQSFTAADRPTPLRPDHATPLIPLRLAVCAAVLLALAACAQGGGPAQATPSPGGWFSPGPQATVTVQRGGGFAGVDDRVVVSPAGSWTATDRAGASSSGELTTAQREQLATLIADPRLADEATRTRQPTRCRDAFEYRVTVEAGSRRQQVTYADCPSDENLPEAAAAIAALVMGAADK
jgi:hypothetical protein